MPGKKVHFQSADAAYLSLSLPLAIHYLTMLNIKMHCSQKTGKSHSAGSMYKIIRVTERLLINNFLLFYLLNKKHKYK